MELQEYIAVFRKWWWLVVIGTVLGASSGYVISRFEPMVYEAKTTLMVGNFVQSPNPDSTELITTQRLAESYAEIIKREPILEATVQALAMNTDWRTLQNKITVQVIPNTQLFEIHVTDINPYNAKAIADEVARQLILQSPTTLNQDQESQRNFAQAELLELQNNIATARQRIKDLQASLELEVTAEDVEERQREIELLQTRLESWQRTYALLVEFSQEEKVNNLVVIEPAIVPTEPVNANDSMKNAILAATFGFVLTVGVSFLFEYFDDSIQSTEDIERVLKLPALAAVTHIQSIGKTGDSVVVNQDIFSPSSEAYRTLRTNLQFSGLPSPSATLLITSSVNSEGKSTTAANLAVVMAQANKRVVIIDADLRRPSLQRVFKIPNHLGLSNLLLNPDIDIETVLNRRKASNLMVIPSGPNPPNPAELLDSPYMDKILKKLRDYADIIIVDSPPLLAVADASILATKVDASLLVIEAGRTHSRVCQRAQETLARVGVQPIGVVLNKFAPRPNSYGYHYYYYSPKNKHSDVEEHNLAV